MKKTLLATAVWAACSTMAFSVNAAVSSGSIFNKDTTISEDVVLTSNGYLNFSDGSKAGYGVYTGAHSVKFTGSNVEVNVNGTNMNAYALMANTGGTIELGQAGGKVTVNATSNQGVIGLWAAGTKDQVGGQFTVKAKDLTINATSTGTGKEGWVYGIYAQNTSVSTTAKRATLLIDAENTVINASSAAGNAAGIVAMSEGDLIIKGNLTVNADTAIIARGDAKVVINEDKSSVVQLNGNVDFNYDKKTSGTKVDADVTVNLSGADSYWNGTATYSYGTGKPPSDKTSVTGMKLGLYNGAQWTPVFVADTTDSEPSGEMPVAINDLSMDGGIVNVKNEKVAVKVNNMSGQGTVRLATDGNTAGTFTVDSAAENSSLTVKLTNEDMSKELTADDVTSEQAKDLLGNVAAKDVETTMKVDEGMYNGAFDVMGDGSTITRGPNSVMQSTLELATVAPLALNRILTNDVHKRMGDIRSMKQTSGAWARYDGGKLSGESGLENDFHTIQVGVDTVPAADAPRFGVAFSYTTSDADYKRGEADMDVYSLAAYGLWMGESGQFVDVVARLGTAKTDMTVDGNKKGSMDNIVTALSGEFGWRFDIAKSFYLEPQVELAYTHVDADDLSLSDGSIYRFDDGDSLMGRAGFMFGMQCPENGNTAYLRVSAVHEFLGDNAVTGGNGTVYEIDGKDTWVEYGLGANFNLTDSTYVWADVERTAGGVLDTDWRATVGVRYSF